jgi:hypothetical protein
MTPETLAVIKSFDVGAAGAADDVSKIQRDTASAATGQTVRVVKLGAPARVRAKPFVIRAVRR